MEMQMTTQPVNLDPVGDASRPWFAHYPPGVTPRISAPAEHSLGELAHAAAEHHGDRTAFSNLGGTLSFREVDEIATRIASYLQNELGLTKGDRIVLQMPNLLQYPVALYGALRAGLVVVNANPLYTATEPCGGPQGRRAARHDRAGKLRGHRLQGGRRHHHRAHDRDRGRGHAPPAQARHRQPGREAGQEDGPRL
ncbi:hypothetical protein GCM10025876_37310 [Demequina litorisediminis]|uniref:AMP-dependent synthetase/ligase domain-containing protein n=1 Tax=Demequina litorisediminis TaxID=1849022 RepID=A0ABQ6IHZ1_9MICO|nr:hypothetical protein GCM10025876_37310 [Demequina litorisediminis]